MPGPLVFFLILNFSMLFSLIRTNRRRLAIITLIITISLSLYSLITIVVLNVNQQITDQTLPLVGADIIIESSQGLTGEALESVEQVLTDYPSTTAQVVEFGTNLISSGGTAQLVQVQGVTESFPLYGQIETLSVGASTPESISIDQATYDQFAVEDTLMIGAQTFTVSQIIQSVPGATVNLFDEGRTIIMPYDLVDSTGLTALGSRVEYEYRIKLDDSSQIPVVLDILQQEPLLHGQYEVEDGQGRIQQISEITTEFQSFITSILIVTLLVVMTTIFIAVQTFFVQQQRSIGIMKILGQTIRQSIVTYISLFGACFVVGRLVSCLLSWIGLEIIRSFELASDFVLYPSVRIIAGLITIVIAIIALSLPLRRMTTTPALALLRPAPLLSRETVWNQGGITLCGIILLYLLTIGNIYSALVFEIGLLVILGLISAVVRGSIRGIQHLLRPRKHSKFMQYDGLRSLTAPGNQSILMSIGLIVALTSILTISGLSRSFLDQLESIGDDQPSLYVLNLLPDDIPSIQSDYPDAVLYDNISSRIQAVNAIPLLEYVQSQGREDADGLTREFNVTSMTLPSEGYTTGSAPLSGEVSLEEGFAQRLGVQVGDTITFFVQGRTFDLQLTSLRAISRDGSGPFFFIQFPAQQFDSAPKTFFWLVDIAEDDKEAFKNDLVSRYDTALSFVDTDEIIQTVTDITSQLITVIQLLLGAIILLVIISIGVSLDAMKSLKSLKVNLYTLLGATTQQLRLSLLSEVISLFVIAIGISLIVSGSILTVSFMMTEFLSWSGGVILQIGVITTSLIAILAVLIRLIRKNILKK